MLIVEFKARTYVQKYNTYDLDILVILIIFFTKFFKQS